MKRILTIFLAIFISISSSAQIQNKLLGFTLGTTTKTAVYNYYKNNHTKVIKNNDDYVVEKVKFAGQVWDYTFFSFHKGKLYSVYFNKSDFFTSLAVLDGLWEHLSTTLMNKYGDYCLNTSSEKIMFSDGKTDVSITYNYLDGHKGIGLMYTNRGLRVQKDEADDNEL